MENRPAATTYLPPTKHTRGEHTVLVFDGENGQQARRTKQQRSQTAHAPAIVSTTWTTQIWCKITQQLSQTKAHAPAIMTTTWITLIWCKVAQPQGRTRPTQWNPQSFLTSHRKCLSPSQRKMKTISDKLLRSNASYVQLKSVDGFSFLQLGRYCFNPETESSSQGLQNPRLKPASFSKTILKMIIQQRLSNPPSSLFVLSLFSFFLH